MSMSSPGPDPVGPHIHIEVDSWRAGIRRDGAAVGTALSGRTVHEALALVPALLPVCGRAQLLAARHAVMAARGQEDPIPGEQNELLEEQAFAAAWRLCVDWPDLLGEPRRMAQLAAIKRARGAVRGALLAGELPGLEAVHSLGELLEWSRHQACPATRIIARAMDQAAQGVRPLAGVQCLAGPGLVETAAEVLAGNSFEYLDPDPRALDVGALAMARDSLVRELQQELGATVLARLLAQLLDARVICRALAQPLPGDDRHGWSQGPGVGLGRALTCRGPVFHRVSLDPLGKRVRDWRVLAPTDWHFALRGPVASGLGLLHSPREMKLLIVSFDPCAPWTLHNAKGVD